MFKRVVRSIIPERLRIVVLGYIVRGPVGGMTWHYLNYVLGLHALGHDVLFVEDSDDYPSCYNPERHTVDDDPAYGLKYIAETFDAVGLKGRWAYFDAHRDAWHGWEKPKLLDFVGSADLLLNISGVNPVREWMLRPEVRAFLDTDPVFTQVRHLQDEAARARAETHTHFFTFGENFGNDDCEMPADGLPWQPTRQPVALDQWPASPVPEGMPFTTIMQWDSYSEVRHAGRAYGMKSLSFEPYAELPARTQSPLEIALGTPTAPRDELRALGWRLTNPLDVSMSPWVYRHYITSSAGEFSVVKHGYAAARSGWFSERSACYLASGRPVILQDTGYSKFLPTGDGLFAFSNADEALSALERCRTDPQGQGEAARALAESEFAAGKVLPRLLESLSEPAKKV